VRLSEEATMRSRSDVPMGWARRCRRSPNRVSSCLRWCTVAAARPGSRSAAPTSTRCWNPAWRRSPSGA